MKILKCLLPLIFFAFAVRASGQATVTPNVGFQLPAFQQANWQVPIDFNFNVIDALLGGSSTLAAGTATPAVVGFTNWITANTGAQAITNFTGGFPGQTIRIICGTGDTYTAIATGADISIVNSPFTCSTGGSITLTLVGSVWFGSGSGPAGAVNEITYSTTPALNPALSNVQQFTCTTAGASISPTATGFTAGRRFVVVVVQNGTTACTWSWPSTIHGGMTVSATLSSINTQEFVVTNNGTDAYAVAAGSTGITGGTP